MDQPSIEDLILAGAVEVAAVDSTTGELLYQFTDKIKDIMPELYRHHLDNIHHEVMFFFEHGFLDIDDISLSNPTIKLTKKAFIKDEISKLSPDAQQSLIEIKRVLKVI